MAIGKKQCSVCGAMCWTQAVRCPAGHDFVKGRSARGSTRPERKEETTKAVVKPVARPVVPTPIHANVATAHVSQRAGVIPDKTFGGEHCPKGAQLVYAAAGEPPPISLEDLVVESKLYEWVRSTRSTGHRLSPPQHYTLSALYAMILHQHSLREETRIAYDLLYSGMTEEQREVA